MQAKKQFHVYSRQEVLIFNGIFCLSLLFCFTLGLHFGKNLFHCDAASLTESAKDIAEFEDSVPSEQEVFNYKKTFDEDLKEALNNEIEDEIKASKIRIENPIQMELPKDPPKH